MKLPNGVGRVVRIVIKGGYVTMDPFGVSVPAMVRRKNRVEFTGDKMREVHIAPAVLGESVQNDKCTLPLPILAMMEHSEKLQIARRRRKPLPFAFPIR